MHEFDWNNFLSGIAIIFTPLSAWYLNTKNQRQSVEDRYVEKMEHQNDTLQQTINDQSNEIEKLKAKLVEAQATLERHNLKIGDK